MKIHIKRVDVSLPLPDYQTSGAVAFDLYSRVDASLAPGEIARLPSNCIISVPRGYALLIAARSSLGAKHGLQLVNGIGVIDQDFQGPEDEIHIAVRNFARTRAEVKRGERIAQGLVIPVERVHWDEHDSADVPTRGGFGSTGH